MQLSNIYSGNYKQMMIVPALLFIVFLIAVLVFPGIKLGTDLKGGTNIIVRSDKPLDKTALETALNQKYRFEELQLSSVSSPSGYGINIQYALELDLDNAQGLYAKAKEQLKQNPESARQLAVQSISAAAKFTESPKTDGLSAEQLVELAGTTSAKATEAFNIGVQDTIKQALGLEDSLRMQKSEVGATLGASFYTQGIMVAAIAFALVVLVVFLFFREFVPSAAIIGAMAFDIVAAMAMMAVLSIPVSLSTIPALLMLIGYSIDTDILLTTRVLKRKDGTPAERAFNSMITGMTMTLTMLAALVSMLILSHFWQIQVVFEISAVLFFGLFADIISTWLMNAPILLWYVDSKAKASGHAGGSNHPRGASQ
ncbi:Protein-export membrane protein SecF [uncultured archaeon]|nr:Protein-export membrane protein SecF [uncultured archaeon]